jgi:metal-responsive CopG/Arc/MetJ family transcriptional regulator
MSRPRLKKEEKKGKLGISLSQDLIKRLNNIVNKSKFIEDLVNDYFKTK